MQIRNTPAQYGLVAKFLHWTVALMIIGVWGVGYYITEAMPKDDPSAHQLYNLHKSTGMAILLLVVIRLSWRLYNSPPRLATMAKPLALLARSVHYSLYVLMFIQPISGWFMSSSAGYPPSMFGLFTFPDIVAKNQESVEFYKDLHNTCAYILLVLLVLHVAGALYHHFIAKDNTLRKMTL